MSASPPWSEAETPVSPVYPFNVPGEPIILYDALVAGPAGTEVSGVVQYDCSPKPGISWRLQTEDYDPTSMVRAELSLLGLGFELPVSGTDAASGWSNGTSYGDPDAALERVVAADVVTRIRNRLVHPKEAQQSVYSVNGLVTEAWLLTRHYLTLLALRSIGYHGAYQDLSRTNGWVGETERVPWA